MTPLLLSAAATKYFITNTKLVEGLVEEYFYIVLAAGGSSNAHTWLQERCTQAVKETPQDFLMDNALLIAAYLKEEDADVSELLFEVVMRLVRIKTASKLEELGSGASFYASKA
jgi:hypothetical protein